MDIWVNVNVENHKKLINAYLEFGLPTADISEENFLSNDAVDVFSYGSPPVCIEILKKVKGCDFSEAYMISKIYNETDLPIRFVHINTLIQAKKAAGRYKDLDDIEKLTQ